MLRIFLSLLVVFLLYGCLANCKRYRRNTETATEEHNSGAFDWIVAKARNTKNRFETFDFHKIFPGEVFCPLFLLSFSLIISSFPA